MIYRNLHTREISFPLGGIGAGCIGLAGNGRLIDWEIFNRSAKGSFNGMSHFAVRAEHGGKVIDARILNGDLQSPFSGAMGKAMFDGFGWGPSRNNLCGLPHFRNHVFKGEYPLAEITFSDESFPADATLCGWSPLIPGNADDSSVPVACFEITLTNTTTETLDYTVIGVLGNPYATPTAYNRHTASANHHCLTVSRGGDTADLAYGDLTLSTLADCSSFQEYWYRGDCVDDLEIYWKDLMTPGVFANRTYLERSSQSTKTDTGLLAVHITLQPGASRRTVFVLTWNIPNRSNDWNSNADAMAQKFGLSNRWKNWYATHWPDSVASNHYVLNNYQRLRTDTFQFHDSLFASTLPDVVLDGISANLAVLKSPTCLRLEDGTFYGWEGVGVNQGSCEGSCTHVWNYAQALPFLFPELERSMRNANYHFNVDDDGGSHFRIMLPLGIKADPSFMRPCVDGQFGDIMKTYRDWKISGNTSWLRELWPTLKRTLEFAWSPANYDRWDPDRSGVITGRQHHTLDMELFGPNAWLTGHYLGALKAAAEIAEVMDDPDFAAECRNIFAKGKTWTDRNLFNGEYYGQKIDLNDQKILERFIRQNDNPTATYWNEEYREIKYQIGDGCEIDMHLPQWYASLYGLGEVLDPDHTRQTLAAIFHHNFKSSMRNVVNTWRIYAVNDEGGAQICTWPQGKRKPVIPLTYASEAMHGFEWALAAHLLMNGMQEEGMAVITSIRQRYDGQNRNPWNELECGSNYARSMASYALLNAFSGFCFDRTRGMLGFAPISAGNDFCCFWSLGDVWGEYRQTDLTQSISLKRGAIELKELRLTGTVNAIEVAEQPVSFTMTTAGCYRLNTPVTLNATGNAVLTVSHS